MIRRFLADCVGVICIFLTLWIGLSAAHIFG